MLVTLSFSAEASLSDLLMMIIFHWRCCLGVNPEYSRYMVCAVPQNCVLFHGITNGFSSHRHNIIYKCIHNFLTWVILYENHPYVNIGSSIPELSCSNWFQLWKMFPNHAQYWTLLPSVKNVSCPFSQKIRKRTERILQKLLKKK